jgi:hypothetical protein
MVSTYMVVTVCNPTRARRQLLASAPRELQRPADAPDTPSIGVYLNPSVPYGHALLRADLKPCPLKPGFTSSCAHSPAKTLRLEPDACGPLQRITGSWTQADNS